MCKWLPLLFDYLSRNSQDEGAQRFYDAIGQQAEAQWEAFYNAHQPAIPPPKKTQDPTKALERTLKRCNDAFEAAPRRNRRKLVEDFSQQLQSLNPVLRDALSVVPIDGSGSSGRTPPGGANMAETADEPVFDDDETTTRAVSSSAQRTPHRIRVSRQRREPLVKRTEELYGAFRAEAVEAGIDEHHPLVASVEQLYGLARELIESSVEGEQ